MSGTEKVYVWPGVLHTGGGDRRYEGRGYDIGEYAGRVADLRELRALCRERNVHFPKKYWPEKPTGTLAQSLPPGHGLWFRSGEEPGARWDDVPLLPREG